MFCRTEGVSFRSDGVFCGRECLLCRSKGMSACRLAGVKKCSSIMF